ncbi:MAG: hypothetical protein HYY16_03070 [Planctomycetes bacterium]|nr:hypothetical protein [Planctomycetota bacterium]
MRIRAGDREGLERLCRTILRPPFSEGRLTPLPDGSWRSSPSWCRRRDFTSRAITKSWRRMPVLEHR